MKDAQEKRKKVEPEVIRQRVEKLLLTARKLIKHKSYVVAGSLSVVNNPNTPIEMLGSPDLDLYTKGDRGEPKNWGWQWDQSPRSSGRTEFTRMPLRQPYSPYREDGRRG